MATTVAVRRLTLFYEVTENHATVCLCIYVVLLCGCDFVVAHMNAGCKGLMNSKARSLGLPAQAVVTDKGAECLWSVQVDPGQRIKLTIERLPTDNCRATQIQVVEPNRQLCHSEGSTGSEVVSSANVIRVSLRSEQFGHQLNGILLATFSSGKMVVLQNT